MDFLHNGTPKKKMVATFTEKSTFRVSAYTKTSSTLLRLKKLLSSPNICSKESVIRQYDYEVKAQTIIKPLVGVKNDGPSDATVMKPIPDLNKGVVISNGINLYGKFDPYWMAASAIDEALRNIISVGGNLKRCALLDNLCWGALDKPEQLGGLVRACEACYDMAVVYGTPFISGKDSLNNKYTFPDGKTVSIPPTFLISAISVIEDVRKCITMDFKNPGNPVYIVGVTKNEFPPKVEPITARKQMLALQRAIELETVASCHDCSEGGIAVCLSEMCFSGEAGCEIFLKQVPIIDKISEEAMLFSESNSRFIVEVKKKKEKQFMGILKGNSFAKIGTIQRDKKLTVKNFDEKNIIETDIYELKRCFKKGLRYD